MDDVWVKHITQEGLSPIKGIRGRWRRWITPTGENRGMIVAVGRLEPGEAMGWHAHAEPEVFYVLEGNGQARWKEGAVEGNAELVPGVAFYKVGGVSHQMVNTGKTPLVGLAFKVADV
jgi:quercetin dioxygenase-like cupin family protein